MAFQGLAVIGAQTAAAATTCSFAGGVITINVGAGEAVEVGQDSGTGTIKFNPNFTAFGDCTPVAPVATTTAIAINGSTLDEFVGIEMWDLAAPTSAVSWGTVDWTINLGSNGVGTTDEIYVDGFPLTDAINVAWGASGIDLNNDGNLDVTHSGVEFLDADGGSGKDKLSAAGSTATGAALTTDIDLFGNGGDDTVTGGSGNDTVEGDAGDDTLAGGLGDDLIEGDAGEDTADFSASATAVTANLGTSNATGQGLDTLNTIEDLIGSKLGDTLTGDGGANVITPGAGDDKVDGAAGLDTVDYSDATAAVTVDLTAGTATGGSGSDSIKNTENATGSAFNDTVKGDTGNNVLKGGGGNDVLSGDKGTNTLEGGTGVDAVDYGWSADPVVLSLNCTTSTGSGVTTGTADTIKTMENATLTTGDDTFIGNEFSNTVFPNGGQNSLNGDCGAGGAGGGDTTNYSVGYTVGVTVNMAGGSTAGDSALNFENAIGTAFNDFITGNAASNTILGGKGNDSIRGGAGDDTLRAQAGNDNVRGGSGDDDMFGGPGKKDVGFGGSGTDLCKGFEKKKGCELK